MTRAGLQPVTLNSGGSKRITGAALEKDVATAIPARSLAIRRTRLRQRYRPQIERAILGLQHQRVRLVVLIQLLHALPLGEGLVWHARSFRMRGDGLIRVQ